MSRGLGDRNLLFLRAIRLLETEDERDAEDCAYYVWTVVDVAWRLELGAEHEARLRRQAQRDMDQAYGDSDGYQKKKALAARGNRQAQQWLARNVQDFIERPTPSEHPTKLRPGPAEWINPSRVLSILERHGLVERDKRHGPGATVWLTPRGREVADSLEPEEEDKFAPPPLERSPTPPR